MLADIGYSFIRENDTVRSMAELDPWRTAGFSSSSTGAGRWDRLFADLESELVAADDAEFAAEVADRTRREFAAVRLVDRLRSAVGAELVASIDAGGTVVVSGTLLEMGPDWLMLTGRPPAVGAAGVPGFDNELTGEGAVSDADGAESGRRLLLPLGAVMALRGLPVVATAPGSEGYVAARYDVGMVLRRLVRDRASAALTLRTGEVVHGVLERAGADFLDVMPRELGEARRFRGEHRLRTIPVAGLAMVRLV